MAKNYELSGKAPETAWAFCALFGLGAAIVLGVVYDLAAVFIPFIYITALITLAYGAAIGYAVYMGAIKGKLRNPVVCGLFGVTCGLIGLYVAWAVHGWAWSIRNGIDPSIPVLLNPAKIKTFAGVLYEHGGWSFKGKPVTGFFLACIWAVEAAFIVVASWLVAWSQLDGAVFCERCDSWNPGPKTLFRFGGPSASLAVQKIAAGNLDPLLETNLTQAGSSGAVRVDLNRCPGCDQTTCLSLIQEIKTVDKKGKAQTEENALIENLLVSAEVADRLVGMPKEIRAAAKAVEEADSGSAATGASEDEPDVEPGDDAQA